MSSQTVLEILNKRKKPRDRIVLMSKRAVVERLLRVMKKHIGLDKRISKLNLFRAVYQIDPTVISELKLWFLQDLLTKACHLSRQRCKCFIVSKTFKENKYSSQGTIRWYWVGNTYACAQTYKDILSKQMRAMGQAKIRADASIRNKHYNLTWQYK